MKRIIILTAVITAISIPAALALRASVQTERRSGLELARFMPARALVYVEFENLGNLLEQWRASSARERYYESANWKQFQRSRLYLKLRRRLEPIEAALGFEITEERLEGLAGRRSAVGIYDIGELRFLFVSEMNRRVALGSELFKQRSAFQERSIDGLTYYAREGAGEEDRPKAEAGFAFADGKLFVASSENLLRRALANTRNDSEDRLSPQLVRATQSLDDFSPHDIAIWLDQKRLNGDRYFRHYWIHRNHSELSDIESSIIDLEIDDGAFRERRWFALSQAASKSPATLISLDELLRFAPASAQLIAVERVQSAETLSRLAATLLLGSASGRPVSPAAGVASSSSLSAAPGQSAALGSGFSRYVNGNDRFNREIDDPTSYSGPQPGGTRRSEGGSPVDETLLARLTDILGASQPREFMIVGEAALDGNRLFVNYHRALILKLARPDAFRARAFEDTVRDGFATRYVVRGVPNRLTWGVSGEVRSLSQAMLDRGGAYAVEHDVLILANQADYCHRVVRAYTASNDPAREEAAAVERFAQVRVQQGEDAYKHVMGMLASPETIPDSNLAIDLFGDNIASLIDLVPNLNAVTLETWRQRNVLRQTAVYRLE